jgi:mRNA-degrading endonuclease toxin of MazEF toxin-antitoxin module
LPNCVLFQVGQLGFATDCVAQCENILSIEKSGIDLMSGPIGVLDASKFREIIKAIGYVMDSDCEPA